MITAVWIALGAVGVALIPVFVGGMRQRERKQREGGSPSDSGATSYAGTKGDSCSSDSSSGGACGGDGGGGGD